MNSIQIKYQWCAPSAFNLDVAPPAVKKRLPTRCDRGSLVGPPGRRSLRAQSSAVSQYQREPAQNGSLILWRRSRLYNIRLAKGKSHFVT